MLKEFTSYLIQIKGYSEHTAAAYYKDLRRFARWASTTRPGITWRTVDAGAIEDYIRWEHEQDTANTTICRRISALRSMYRWAIYHEKLKDNPARWTQTPKRTKTIPHTIEIQAIQGALISPMTELRTKCMIAILADTGLRLQEMLDLETSDFDKTTKTIHVRGKGAKERTVYYSETSARWLNIYARHRRGKIFDIDQRKAREEIYWSLRPYSRRAKLSPHIIRHTFATELLRNGAHIESIQAILGHESVKTTEIYAKVAGANVATDYKKYHQL